MADVKHSKCFVLWTCRFESDHRHHGYVLIAFESAVRTLVFYVPHIATRRSVADGHAFSCLDAHILVPARKHIRNFNGADAVVVNPDFLICTR